MAMLGIRGSLARSVSLGMAAVSLAWLLNTGCGGSGQAPPPKTYPVGGMVVYKGGQPLSGGAIQFQSKSDPNLTTKGDIGPDGTFELVTLYQDEQLQGATEGQYHVTVIPRMTENKPVDIFQLPRVYTVETKDNYFRIELEKPRDRRSP
jgi:hypothetical protein